MVKAPARQGLAHSYRVCERAFAAVAAVLMMAVCASRSAGARQQQKEAVPRGEFRIGGTMVDGQDGRPLARTTVTISPAMDRAATRAVLTGADGRFLFPGVAAGKYVLSAKRRGYTEQAYKQHDQYSTAIVTGPKLNSSNIRFALQAGAVITGTVIDEGNEQVRNATVQLFSRRVFDGERGAHWEKTANTDDEGRYRFYGLTPGAYVVMVDAQPWYSLGPKIVSPVNGESLGSDGAVFLQPAANDPALDVVYRPTYFLNAFEAEEASPIQVSAGESATADFSMYPIPSLHVVVNNVEGRAVTVVQGVRNQAVAPESGAVEVSGMAPGPITVVVTSNGDAGPPPQTQSLNLTGNVELNAATFIGETAIRGTVKMANGSVVPGNMVIALDGDGSEVPPHAQVGANGEFDFSTEGAASGVQPGEYAFQVQEPQGTVVGMTASGAKAVGRKLILNGEKEVKVALTVALGQASVSGVALQDGQPAEGVMMLLVPMNYGGNVELFRRDQSDSDGTFTFGDVVPGKYVAVAIADGWELEWSRREAVEKYLARGTKVEVSTTGVEGVKVEVQ